MKNTRNSLYQLVKTLSKGEKRYFQLFSKFQNGDKQYLALFDAINSYKFPSVNTWERFKESDLKTSLADRIPEAHFSNVKRYLLEQLLYSLRLYHRKESVDWKIYLNLMDREILLEKGMENLAEACLEEAKKKAKKNERYYLLLYILDLQIHYVVEHPEADSMDKIELLYLEKERYFKDLQNENRYREINHQAFLLYKMGKRARTPEIVSKIEKLLADPILQNIGEAQTFEAKINMYNAKAILHNLRRATPMNAKFASQKVVETMENNPLMKGLYPRRYFIYLNNYLQLCHRTGHYEEFPGIWKKMNKIMPKNKEEEAEYELKIYQTQLLYYMNTGQPDKAKKAAEATEKKIDAYSDLSKTFKESKESTSRFNLAMYYFVLENFKKSRDIFHLFTSERLSTRDDLNATSRIFELICWNEKEDDSNFLEYLSNSTRRQLRKKGVLFEFENKFLSLLARISNLPDRNTKERKLRSFLEKEITQLEEEGIHIPGKEEIRFWIRSKLERKRIIDLFLEEVQNQRNES